MPSIDSYYLGFILELKANTALNKSNSGNLRNISGGKDVCSRKLSYSRVLRCHTDFTSVKQTLRIS